MNKRVHKLREIKSMKPLDRSTGLFKITGQIKGFIPTYVSNFSSPFLLNDQVKKFSCTMEKLLKTV